MKGFNENHEYLPECGIAKQSALTVAYYLHNTSGWERG